MKQQGMTLIEIMVILVIGLIIVSVAWPVIMGSTGQTSNVSWGINGVAESRCIEGYKFIVGERGQPRQIIDEFGKGVRCQQEMLIK